MRRKYRSITALLGALLTCFALSHSVIAAVPYDNYIYDSNGEIIDAPPAVTPTKVVTELGASAAGMKGPQDLYVDARGNLFVADTGNNRILKLNSDFEVVKEYATFDSDGNADGFKTPTGIYVNAKGYLFVADTDNARIVKLTSDGKLAAIYKAPQSELLPNNFDYKPTKVVCDSAGRIFVISRGFNMGLLELDSNGKFVQMLGAPEVTYSLADMLWRLISTKEQRDRMASFVPTEYNNVSVDKDNFIFVTTGTVDENAAILDPVRKLSAKGTDVLRRLGDPSADLEWNGISIKGASLIVDVVNLDYGIYGILDQRRGRVFVYNTDGMPLFMFGGLGQTFGTLSSPASLAYYNNNFIVLDASKNALVVYSATEYGNLLFSAEQYKSENDFAKEEDAWRNVLSYNENNPLALVEMGKAAYKQRDMITAMEYFKQAGNQDNYSKAFQFYRRDLINQYFTVGGIIVIVVAVLLIAFAIFMKAYRKKHPKKDGKNPFRYAFHVILRPLDGFWDLKYEKRGSIKVSFAIMGLACVAMIINAQFAGFIFQPNPEQKTNFFISIATVMAPVILWIISTRCVTSLMNGEGSLNNIIIATGYALTPIVIVVPFATILSNIFTQQEGAVYYFFMSFALIWTVWLIVASVKQTHDYSFGRTLFIILLSLLVILIIVFIGLLCVALIQQIVAFVTDVISELNNR